MHGTQISKAFLPAAAVLYQLLPVWKSGEGARTVGKLETYCAGLMCRANRGDAAAYHLLLRKLASVLRSSARRVGCRCSLEDIEDAIQETLLALHLQRHTWDESRPLLPWVRAILKNKLTDVSRRRGGRVHLCIDEVAATLADAPIPVARRLDTELVLGRLRGRQRDVVVSIAIEGGSARQVAARLGMSEGAVRVCLHRALKAMARTFAEAAANVSRTERAAAPRDLCALPRTRDYLSLESRLGHAMRAPA